MTLRIDVHKKFFGGYVARAQRDGDSPLKPSGQGQGDTLEAAQQAAIADYLLRERDEGR